MKVHLLFTAAVMTAASMATQNVFAGQGLSFSTALMASASPEGETEFEDNADEALDYSSKVENPFSYTQETKPNQWVTYGEGIGCSYEWDNNLQIQNNAKVKGELTKEGDCLFLERYYHYGALGTNDGCFTVLEDMPNGTYTVKIAAFVNKDDAVVNAFANDVATAVQSNGSLKYYTLENVNVADHRLTLGLRCGKGNTANWIGLTDVTVTYNAGKRGILSSVISEAETLLATVGVSDATFSAAITTAKETYNNSSSTGSECEFAVTTLQTAMETYAIANASKDHPANLTGKITNQNFSDQTNGWNIEISTAGKNVGWSNLTAEIWTGIFDLNQTISNLPQGIYKVGTQASRTIYSGEDTYSLYAQNGENAEVSQIIEHATIAKDAARNDLHQQNIYFLNNPSASRTYLNVTVDESGELKLGIRCTDTNAWCVWDDFTLEYLGVDYTDLWNECKSKAQQVINSGIPSGMVSQMNTIMEKDASQSNINELNALIPIAQALVKPYASYNDIKAYAQSMLESLTDVETTHKETFETTFTTQNSAVENAENSETITNALAALKDACVIFAGQASPASGEQFDITRLFLVNPEVSAFASWGSVEGWYGDMNGLTDEGIRCQHNNAQIGETSSDAFFEHYAGVPLATGWTIYQKATLSAGNYKMSVAAFASPVNNIAGTGNAVAALYAGEQRGDKVNSTTLAYGSVYFTLAEGSEVNLGMKFEDGNLANWAGLNDMHLYKIGSAVDMTLSETGTYAVTENTYANVTLNRTLKADDKWNTFCVPFDMPIDEFSAVKKLTAASTEGETTSLTFEEATSIEAGVPYIVKVAEAKTSLTVDGVVVKAAAPEALTITDAQGNTISMIGNYETQAINGNEFFISNNAFYIADRDVRVKGFRAYIKMEAAAQASEVNRMLINIDGETTAIEDVLNEEETLPEKAVDVYTISGIKVKANTRKADALNGLPKGIYIVDGKKIVK